MHVMPLLCCLQVAFEMPHSFITPSLVFTFLKYKVSDAVNVFICFAACYADNKILRAWCHAVSGHSWADDRSFNSVYVSLTSAVSTKYHRSEVVVFERKWCTGRPLRS